MNWEEGKLSGNNRTGKLNRRGDWGDTSNILEGLRTVNEVISRTETPDVPYTEHYHEREICILLPQSSKAAPGSIVPVTLW